MPKNFRFRWIPFIAAMLAMALGVSLGQWQMRRAAEKESIEAMLTAREAAPETMIGTAPVDAGELEYRRIAVKGEFVADWPIYLDNRPHKGAAGFYLLMPLKIAGSDMHILVARGWIPRNAADRTDVPQIPVPKGIVELRGMAKRNPGRLLQLGEAGPPAPGAIVQNLDIQAFARASNLKLHSIIVEQTSDTQDGLVRDWPRPSSGVDKHYGYAFQWYALAATALLFFIVTGIRREAGKQKTACR